MDSEKTREYVEEIKRQYKDGELLQTEFNDLVDEVFERDELKEYMKRWRYNRDESSIIEAQLEYFIDNYT